MNNELAKLKELADAVINTRKHRRALVVTKHSIALNSLERAVTPEVIIALIEQLEAAQRERDEAVLLRLEVSGALSSATVRYEQAEAELKRRDAQEPVAWISERNLKNLGKQFSVYVKHEPVMVRPVALYTHPAALPPKISED